MIAINLLTTYDKLKEAGLVRSKREFSRIFLGKHDGYVADVIYRDILGARGGLPLMQGLRDRLAEVAMQVPDILRSEVSGIITGIEAGMRVAEIMASGR